MNMNSEMLEILIGKYLDGQITAEENRMLQEAMEADDQARELFEQLQEFHQQCEEAVSTEVLAGGKDFNEIFENAWQRRRPRIIRMIMSPGIVRFAAGLAAGILIGIGINIFISNGQAGSGGAGPERLLAAKPVNERSDIVTTVADFGPLPSRRPGAVSRDTDWYTFTDDEGNKWLVEGLRENAVKRATYNSL